jgi:hypothetical protein
MTMIDTNSLKTEYDEQGFVIVHGLVSPEGRSALEYACKEVISRTRSGSWTHRRTVCNNGSDKFALTSD